MGDFAVEAKPWDVIELRADRTLTEKMDRILIPLSDVKRAVWMAEGSGSGFVNEAGELLLCGELETLTVWAKLRKTGENQFELLDVYAHRMRVGKGEA